VVCFDFEQNKMWTRPTTFGLFDKNWTVHKGNFQSQYLNSRNLNFSEIMSEKFLQCYKIWIFPEQFHKLKNVHFWKDCFYNISPIIGSSNHKGIVFLFFVFVSLDENQSSQYSFSRKEEVCFHFFLQFEIFFVKISLLFGAFLPCMYVFSLKVFF